MLHTVHGVMKSQTQLSDCTELSNMNVTNFMKVINFMPVFQFMKVTFMEVLILWNIYLHLLRDRNIYLPRDVNIYTEI